MKAVIYARYSTDMQNQDSIEAQVRECTKYAQKNNLEIVNTYSDEALTGKTDDRPAFQQMIQDAKKGLFDALIVHKIDRFARNKYDSAIYKSQLRRNGIKIFYAAQPLTDDPEGRLMEGILESFAQYYSENLAGEVMKGLKTKAYRQEFCGGIPPLGYDVVEKKYVINEYEANIIRLIFDMHANGKTYGEIFDTLKEKGYKTKAGKEFGQNSLNSILNNQKYIGTYVFNKTATKFNGVTNSHKFKPQEEIIIVPDGIPAIVDKNIWERSQKRIGDWKLKRAQFKTKVNYLLGGLIFCEFCGKPMTGDSQTNSAGTTYHYYRCQKKLGNKCKHYIRKEIAESHVLEMWDKNFFEPGAINRLVKKLNTHQKDNYNKRQDELKTLEKELNKVNGEINNLVTAIASGLKLESLGAKLKDLEAYKTSLNMDIFRIKTADTNMFSADEIAENLNAHKLFVQNRDLAHCKSIIDKYVQKVIVGENEIKVVFGLDYLVRQLKSGISNVDTDGCGSATPTISTQRIIKEEPYYYN